MALTLSLISKASDHLSSVSIELWQTLFKELPLYQQYALVYSPLIEDAITSTEGTIKARQLNALMTLLDDLGPGEFSIKGDSDGLNYSLPQERMALINEAFSIIFDSISTMIVPSSSVYGTEVAVGQRPPCGCSSINSCSHGSYCYTCSRFNCRSHPC